MKHAVIEIRLRAEIGDYKFDREVYQFASTFAINQIPTATISLGLGRNENDKLSKAHSFAKNFTGQLPAKIFLYAKNLDAEGLRTGVADGEICIFDGRAVGMGIGLNPRTARYTVSLLHWLSALDYASAVSSSSHPGNPANWIWPAVSQAMGIPRAVPAAGAFTQNSWTTSLRSQFVNTLALSDLWGNVLHKWMADRAAADPISILLTQGVRPPGNVEVLAAINRIGINPAGMPLAMDLAGQDGAVIADSLRRAILEDTAQSWVNNTLWGKLVGDWSPKFWLAVIPRISDALIVPFASSLSGAPWSTIASSSASDVNISGQIQRELRAVGIVHPATWQTGASGIPGSASLSNSGLVGTYQPSIAREGVILLKSAPSWIGQTLPIHLFALGATGTNGQAVDTAIDGGAPRQPDPTARGVAGIFARRRLLMDKYAQQWYVLEKLKNRTGEVSGKLRFDICPGSSIRLRVARPTNVPEGGDGLVQNFYGNVTGVAYFINSEERSANTAFSLAHVRSEAENSIEGMTVAAPPLYKNAWYGARMLEHPAINPEP